ncbi:MAG: acyltransferase [Pseudomonadota bacterium]
MKLHSIQMLRAVAALLVVGFHIRAVQADTRADLDNAPRDYSDWPLIENGYVGVDLFFVISGFVMVLVTRSSGWGLRASGMFLLSRSARIYPIWWLFAGIMTAYMIVTYGAVNTGDGGWADLAGSTSVSAYLAQSFALLPQQGYPVLGVGWTLIHEMYFYVVFAVTLLFARRWLWLFLLAWGAVTLGLVMSGQSRPLAVSLLSLAAHPMTLEFIAGSFAGLAVCSGRRIAPVTLAVLASVWLIAALAFTLPADQPGSLAGGLVAMTGHQFSITSGENWSTFVLEWGRVIVFCPPSALLVYAIASCEVDRKLPVSKSLAVVGDWSYALYLSHILVLVGIARLSPSLAAGPFFALVALPTCLVLAGITYTLVERPMMATFSRWRSRKLQANTNLPQPAPLATKIW